MARRVSVLPRRMSNTGQDCKTQDFLRACRIAIAANTSCLPTNTVGAVSNSAGGNCACTVKIMAKNRILVKWCGRGTRNRITTWSGLIRDDTRGGASTGRPCAVKIANVLERST